MSFAKGMQLLVGVAVVLLATTGPGSVDAAQPTSHQVPSLVPLGDGSEAPRRGLKQTIRLVDPSASLPPGSELGLFYNKLTPLPGADGTYVVLATWTGRQLSSIPGITLNASWPAAEDGTTSGCVIICFTENGSKFCPSGAPVVNIGSGSVSAACDASDLFAVASRRNPGSWDLYVAGSFTGEVLHQSGGAQPSTCTNNTEGCGFIGLASVSPGFQMNLENFDFIRGADRAEDPDSHIGRLSPSVFGVWLSGTVSGGSGTFGGEANAAGAGNFTLTSGSEPRGFIGHFANEEFGFGLSWAKSLSDGRMTSDSPQISNVADSPDCTVIFADEYKAGAPLFQNTWTPDSIPVAKFTAKTGGLPSAVIVASFQLRAGAGLANVCRDPSAEGAQSLLTGWKIADGGKVNVISSRFRAGSDTSAFAFVAITPSESFPSIAAGLYKSEIDRNPETKRIKGSASAGPFIFADQGIEVTAVKGLSYDPYSEGWFFALQRTPQTCTVAAFDSVKETAIFADVDKRPICDCELENFASKSEISPETGEPLTQISITGSFSSGCAPKPSGSFAFSYPSLSPTIVDPGQVAFTLLKVATGNRTIARKDLILAGSRLSLFPDNPEILEGSFSLVEKAVTDAIASGNGLDMPASTFRVTSVLNAAVATPQFQSRAAKALSLLPLAIAQGATTTSEVTERAVAVGAMPQELGASTDVLRTSVAAAQLIVDRVASSDTIEFSNEAIDSLIPVLQQAARVKGLDATDLRNQAVNLQVLLPAQRLANAKTKKQVEEAVTKIQEWVGTASECPVNTCGESELAVASLSAINVMLDRAEATPALISPTSAQAMLDLLLSYQADTDPAIVASLATKLSRVIVKNSAPTSEGLEQTLATLSLMSETLRDNPAAIDGLAGSLVELQTAAVATPGLELSEPAFQDAIQLVQTVIQNGDSASSIDVVGRVPSMVVSGITTLDQLDAAGSRLASTISMFEDQSRFMVLLEATDTLVDEIPKRGALDVSPELFEHVTDIISAGKRPSATAEEINLANTISEKLTTIITDIVGFDDSIALDATLLQKNLFMHYGDANEQRVLIASLEGVNDIVTKAERLEDVRLRVKVVIPVVKILMRAIEGDIIPTTAKSTAIKLAQRLPATATESKIDASTVQQASSTLRYLAQAFSEYKIVVSKAVEEADRIVSAVEADDSLRLSEKNLQNVLSVLSVGIQTDANAELAWAMVEKLPYILKKSLSPGETMQAGAEDLQMTLMWTTIQDPPVKGTTAYNISDTEHNVTSRIVFPRGVMESASHYVVLRHSTVKPPSLSDLNSGNNATNVQAVSIASKGTMGISLLDPTTMEPVHARRLQQVSEASQDLTYTFHNNINGMEPAQDETLDTIHAPQCARADSDTGMVSANDCIPIPRFLPRGFQSLPNPNYKFPPPADSLEPVWIIRPIDPEREIDCRTVRNLNPYPAWGESQKVFGDVTFQGTECWFYDNNWDNPSADNVYPERGQNCVWCDLAQFFVGPDCEFTPDEDGLQLGCVCIKTTGESWFQRITIDNKVTITTTVDKTDEFVADKELDTLLTTVFAPILGVICLGAGIIIFACFWDVKRRSALLGKFFEAKHSFQCSSARTANGSSCCTQIGNFNLRDHQDEVWRWSIETHVFKVLADDMELYITLAPSQQSIHDFFDSDVVRFCALVGLPIHRVIACIPSSDSLSWYPLNKKRRNITGWRNQALGTSLAMGFFLNNSLISDQVAEEQIEKQNAYFAGCHPMGMRALIRRWRVMLNRRNVQDYGRGWHDRCRVWKIIWLQRHDGLWDLTEDFLTAIGADPELLLGVYCGKVPAQGGKECVENQVPAALEVLFYGESELRIQLWCTFLAKAFLELAKNTFAEFSGREPDNTSEIPTLSTVIAKDAILFAINQKQMVQVLIDDLSEVHCQGTDELVATVEDDALQLVRSFSILREERQKAWASEELAFITHETMQERQKRKQKEGTGADFSKKDFAVVLTDLENRMFKRSLSLMVSRGEEIAPSGIARAANFITGCFGQIFHAIFYWHGAIRIGFSSITDSLIVQERTLVVCTTWLFMLAMLAVMFETAGEKCCELTEEYYQCGTSEYGPEYCVYYNVTQFKAPSGLRYNSNTTELISHKLSCSALTLYYPPDPASFDGEERPTHVDCDLFPNYTRVSDIILVSFIVAAIALPLKIILKKIFNARRRMSFSSLWIGSSGIISKMKESMRTLSGRTAKQVEQLALLKPVEDLNAMVGKPLIVIGEKVKVEKQKKSSGHGAGKVKAAAATPAKRTPKEVSLQPALSPAPVAMGAETSGGTGDNPASQSYQHHTRHQSLILNKRSGRRPPPMLQTHASYI